MSANKILVVMNREIRALVEAYARAPKRFDPKDLKDKIQHLTAWAEAAEKSSNDTDFIEFTQFHIDVTKR